MLCSQPPRQSSCPRSSEDSTQVTGSWYCVVGSASINALLMAHGQLDQQTDFQVLREKLSKADFNQFLIQLTISCWPLAQQESVNQNKHRRSKERFKKAKCNMVAHLEPMCSSLRLNVSCSGGTRDGGRGSCLVGPPARSSPSYSSA